MVSEKILMCTKLGQTSLHDQKKGREGSKIVELAEHFSNREVGEPPSPSFLLFIIKIALPIIKTLTMKDSIRRQLLLISKN